MIRVMAINITSMREEFASTSWKFDLGDLNIFSGHLKSREHVRNAIQRSQKVYNFHHGDGAELLKILFKTNYGFIMEEPHAKVEVDIPAIQGEPLLTISEAAPRDIDFLQAKPKDFQLFEVMEENKKTTREYSIKRGVAIAKIAQEKQVFCLTDSFGVLEGIRQIMGTGVLDSKEVKHFFFEEGAEIVCETLKVVPEEAWKKN